MFGPKKLRPITHYIAPGLFVGALFVLLVIRRPTTTIHRVNGEIMGTTWSVTVYGSSAMFSNLQQEIEPILNDVNRKMSTYLPDSEVSKFNREQSSFVFSSETTSVLIEALRIYNITSGAFDVTVGPLVNAWGFGFPPQTQNSPDDIKRIKSFVGSDKLRLDGNTLHKTDPRVKIDLSAIAKGYAVDNVAKHLESIGAANFLIEVGGELKAKGTAGERSWNIGIEQPEASRGVTNLQIRLQDAALATSGDYRNYYEKDGLRISHTIDPRTGAPITHQLASVSVISTSTMTADAWVTALSVLGPDEAFSLAEQHKLAIYMLIRDEDGGFLPRSSSFFEQFVQSSNQGDTP